MPDNGAEKKNDWLALKIPGTTALAPYEFEERAELVHCQWSVGFEYDEIAAFFNISEIDVKLDMQHVLSRLTARQVLSQTNDRNRILIQRTNSKEYSRLLQESLTITASSYLAAGMSPVPAMKEFRQAVSMEEKPGGLSINFTKNTANFGNGTGVNSANVGGRHGVKSAEDLIRMIIAQDPSCGLQPVMDIDAQETTPLPDTGEEGSPSDDGDNEPIETGEDTTQYY
jgi:hypothetical protein